MKQFVSTALLAGLPVLAQAQQPVVPALAQAIASASAGAGAVGAAQAGRPAAPGSQGVPASMPPPIGLLSPSAPLNAKERQGVALARTWRNRAEMPQRGEDGVVRFLFGATLPTVVCAPLQVCDVALQPGEVVNGVNVGDKVRWNVSPGVSGPPTARVTHLIIKPTDAGLISSLLIQTNRRTYAIKLVSTRHEWMPLVAFTYPDEPQRAWMAYQQTTGIGTAPTPGPAGENAADLDFGFRISGDDPGWRPLRVYSDGEKTYIQFPPSIAAGAAPALVALDNDGGWFSSPTEQMVNYRVQGDRYVVDRVLERAELVSGIGAGQTRVVITKDGAR